MINAFSYRFVYHLRQIVHTLCFCLSLATNRYPVTYILVVYVTQKLIDINCNSSRNFTFIAYAFPITPTPVENMHFLNLLLKLMCQRFCNTNVFGLAINLINERTAPLRTAPNRFIPFRNELHVSHNAQRTRQPRHAFPPRQASTKAGSGRNKRRRGDRRASVVLLK